MGKEVTANIISANELFKEAASAGLNYGCLEVSLQALGSETHLVEILGGNPSEYSSLLDIVWRRGFQIGWIFQFNDSSDSEAIDDLLEGRDSLPKPQPIGKLAGYLGLECYLDPNSDHTQHVIAILPRQHLPRDRRRALKKKKAYLAVDTSCGGSIPVTADNLAHYAQLVRDQGGVFAIAQLFH